MRIIHKALAVAFLLIAIQSCKTSKNTLVADEFVEMDTITIVAEPEIGIYQASEKRINDLLHTKLEVKFDWDSTFLYGKAHLRLTPYFYPTNTLTLDAKGFKINKVALVDNIGKQTPLKYSYDDEFLVIDLAKLYTRKDTYNIFVDYVAMPNKLKASGSSAITSEKGLYFINPDGKDPNKPKQIWTQGETESSSCWFPTIDSPNEKTTQEIYMTVDNKYVTLSNGELMFQSENEDGTRTDYWKQALPHAPYLFMMAVGEFAIVEDSWKNIPVNYYVEEKYKPYAKDIYANTPEMLQFFSDKLGYEYPWDKYHQIVVRDYVSGAMENTGAVIFGDFIQGDDRFLVDNSGEDIVAHEMFHHWFGDLVTCESWANLPLNESFATYGEYLWNEHKYGKNQADLHIDGDLATYLSQGKNNPKTLIRFDYKNEMEMFDSHSYQKGGRVLNMLRNYLGDDAFFSGLKHYLHSNEFQTVEIHQLRLAFEKVSGEDLNWFFNQWFLAAGHPEIDIEKSFTNDTLTITVEQKQEGEDIAPIFILPTKIGIIQANNELLVHEVTIDERKQTIKIPMSAAPKLVNFDWDKILLGVVNQDIDKDEAITLYNNCNHFLDKKEALNLIKNRKDSASLNIIEKAMTDGFWFIRKQAAATTKKLAKERPESTMEKLKELALNDPKSNVRSTATRNLAKYFKNVVPVTFYEKGIKEDISYNVMTASLNAAYDTDKKYGLEQAILLKDKDNSATILALGNIFSEEKNPEYLSYYQNSLNSLAGFNKYPFLMSFNQYLENQEDYELLEKSVSTLKTESMGEGFWFVRMAAINSLISVKHKTEDEIDSYTADLVTITDESKKTDTKEKLDRATALKNNINKALQEIYSEEDNKNLKSILEGEIK